MCQLRGGANEQNFGDWFCAAYNVAGGDSLIRARSHSGPTYGSRKRPYTDSSIA